MAPAEPQVTVHAAPGSGLGAALLAALDRRGWRPVARPQGWDPGERHVLVVENDDGRPASAVVSRPDRVIAIGSLRSASTLAALAARGAVVLNQDVPFLMLLRQVETSLGAEPTLGRTGTGAQSQDRRLTDAAARQRRGSGPSRTPLLRTHPHRSGPLQLESPESGAEQADRVRERAAEARALARLTERERAVLCGLAQGLSAATLAQQGSRSVATIRSQIQSLTRRLGVGSSLAAVAMLHRSGHLAEPGCLEALHQF